MKRVLVVLPFIGMMQIQASAQDRTFLRIGGATARSIAASSAPGGSGFILDVDPRQSVGVYAFMKPIGDSPFALGAFTLISRRDGSHEPSVAMTGPQFQYNPTDNVAIYVWSAGNVGEGAFQRNMGTFSLTTGILVRSVDVAKVIGKGFRRIFR